MSEWQVLISGDNDLELWKQRIYSYSRRFGIKCCLDSNGYAPPAFTASSYELICGLGARRILKPGGEDPFDELARFHQDSWVFGYLSYDLKNHIEKLESCHPDRAGFPEVFFFEPEILISIQNKRLSIQGKEAEAIAAELLEIPLVEADLPLVEEFQSNMSPEEYIQKVEAIRNHIEEGDVYELNLCVEFYSEALINDACAAWLAIRKLSPAPFSAYLDFGNHVLFSSSPERFLKKEGSRLLSQPIKGTMRRVNDPAEDRRLAQALLNSEKDRAENVMIVDLVRNDLSRSCVPGSVKVEELFGIYSFPRVHQMISSVSGTLRDDIHWTRAIRNAFPMGSMTGAPKVIAMELIEQYERSKRGVYSGALGYVTPDADFDFNVVIRSFACNRESRTISYHAGGAITYDSDPWEEWKEIKVKAGILQMLGKK